MNLQHRTPVHAVAATFQLVCALARRNTRLVDFIVIRKVYAIQVNLTQFVQNREAECKIISPQLLVQTLKSF